MSYTVNTHPGGHAFSVEADETLLDAALRHGLLFPYGCRSGVCGACKATVRSGRTAYPKTPGGLDKIRQDAGEVLCCQVVPESDLVLEVREVERPADIQTKKLPCRVEKLKRLSPDVMQVLLKLPDNERLAFLAGQYLDIVLRDGRHRSFSMANPPHADDFLELHIRHVPGGEFTSFVFEKLQEKDLLRLEGPFGTFFLREDSTRPIILVAGGTGFAPIKSIIEHAIAAGVQRPLYFYWGVRAKIDLYLDELAQSWATQHSHIHYIPVLSSPLPQEQWNGRNGFVHQAVLEDFSDFSAYDVYACGPPVMINAVRAALSARGLDEAHFYTDSFDFAADKRPAAEN